MGRLAVVLCAVLLLATAAMAWADQREDPMDVIIALDKSLSMEEEIQAVKEYVATTVIGDLLIPHDLLVVVAFFGQTEVLVSQEVTDETSREQMRQAVRSIEANGLWTDIGGALDELERQLGARGRPGVPKHLLLITDGKQEAPPESPYWSADGTFSHAFLANTRTIQREGWKVQVLGLGSEAEAKEIADKLSGVYTEVPDSATAEQLAESTREFFGSMTVVGKARLSRVGRGGRATLDLDIKSTGYEQAKTVTVNAVRLEVGSAVRETILPDPQVLTIAPEAVTPVRLPLVVEPVPEPGRYAATLELVFQGPDQFVPAVLDHELAVNGPFRNYLFIIIPGVVLILAAIALVAVLLARRTAAARLVFRLAVKEAPLPKGHDSFSLSLGKSLYLRSEGDKLVLDPEKTDACVARLGASGEKGSTPSLELEILNPKRFLHPDKIPHAPAGAEIALKTDTGRLHFTIEVPPGNA